MNFFRSKCQKRQMKCISIPIFCENRIIFEQVDSNMIRFSRNFLHILIDSKLNQLLNLIKAPSGCQKTPRLFFFSSFFDFSPFWHAGCYLKMRKVATGSVCMPDIWILSSFIFPSYNSLWAENGCLLRMSRQPFQHWQRCFKWQTFWSKHASFYWLSQVDMGLNEFTFSRSPTIGWSPKSFWTWRFPVQ